MIHRKVCANALAYLQNDPERLLAMDWQPDGNVYGVSLRIVTLERQGLMSDVTTMFAEAKANIIRMAVKQTRGTTFEWDVTIEVQNQEHLNLVMTKISNLSDVFSILRVHGRTGSK
jgi:GTP pyrophosphokinase